MCQVHLEGSRVLVYERSEEVDFVLSVSVGPKRIRSFPCVFVLVPVSSVLQRIVFVDDES